MGVKLLWTGLVIILATSWLHIPQSVIVGSIIMFIGCILMWLDK